jgi:hypothetical protein
VALHRHPENGSESARTASGEGASTDIAYRLDRLEDALIDLATIVTEGAISRPSVLVGPEGTEASERFTAFVSAVRMERSS